jgi:hypothetical protein
MTAQCDYLQRKISDEQRVQNGIRLLNEKNPGWWRKIDLKKIDQSDVIFQLYFSNDSHVFWTADLKWIGPYLAIMAYGFSRDKDTIKIWKREIIKLKQRK